jgi:hypothetical protein
MLLNPVEQRRCLNNGTYRVAALSTRQNLTIGVKIATDDCSWIVITLFWFHATYIQNRRASFNAYCFTELETSRSDNSSFSIETMLLAARPRFDSQHGRVVLFVTASSMLSSRNVGFFHRGKAARAWSPSAVVKEEWVCTFSTPYVCLT